MNTAVDDELWSAVGDPTRRRMLDLLLSEGSGTATGLAEHLPVTRQAVSKHLAVLDRVGLVHATVTGREKHYRVDGAQLARAAAQFAEVGATWDARLQRIKRIAERIQRSTDEGDSPGPPAKTHKTHKENQTDENQQLERNKEMVDILHRIGVEGSSPEKVYDALTTLDGLSGWWTEQTTGDPGIEGVIAFKFERGGFDMKVLESEPGRRVLWEVVDGPPEWIGTKVHWDIRQEEAWTIVQFKHEGWREPVDFMYHCSTKWASFLFSLKDLVQTGKGAPAPNDFRVDDWD